ncbi:MAG: hypothetical protein H7174_01130 [Flavobacterium sp.]|nr:hypothetical protein [Flavobacterium sp.]
MNKLTKIKIGLKKLWHNQIDFLKTIDYLEKQQIGAIQKAKPTVGKNKTKIMAN